MEWRALLEHLAGIHILETDEIGGEWGVVMRKIPCPRGAAMHIVREDPAKSFSILPSDFMPECDIVWFDMKFLLVIALLVPVLLCKVSVCFSCCSHRCSYPEHDGVCLALLWGWGSLGG
jgi:hypothetical protein